MVSIASSFGLDLYVSASSDSICTRVSSTNRYFCAIVPELSRAMKYSIFKILMSARGYIVIQARTAFCACEPDMLVVYSINGAKIAEQKMDEFLNAMLMDPTEYFVVYERNQLWGNR